MSLEYFSQATGPRRSETVSSKYPWWAHIPTPCHQSIIHGLEDQDNVKQSHQNTIGGRAIPKPCHHNTISGREDQDNAETRSVKYYWRARNSETMLSEYY